MSQLKKMYSRLLGEEFPDTLTIILGEEKLVYKKRQWTLAGEEKGLRYGENPDQPAALYQLCEGEINIGGIKWRGPGNALISALDERQMIQAGKHPGKTNLTDVDNGANILQYLSRKPACVIMKHNNPCGAAWVDVDKGGGMAALEKAWWCDRIAAFGGAVITNFPLQKDACEMLAENYFEVVAAPAFEDDCIAILKSRKNLRIMELPGLGRLDEFLESAWLDIKSLADGGIIVQKSFQNRVLLESDFLPASATVDGVEVIARSPDKKEFEDLLFAWAVESGVTSNSVIFAREGATLAIGTGEQDRVGCVELAIHKAFTKYADSLSYKENGLSLYELEQKAKKEEEFANILENIKKRTAKAHGDLAGSRMVSDGFFPFRDGVDIAISVGVSAIAHPGGSLRDAESIIACNQANPQVAMVFTGQRSFKH